MLPTFAKLSKKAVIVRLAVLAAIAVVLIYSHLLKVVHYDVAVLPKGARPLKIALITDLHACYYGNEQRWLVDELQAQHPDVILLGGDIYDDQRAFDHADALLAQLPAIAPSYYVDGNHENWLPRADYDDVMGRIAGHGVQIIHGKKIWLPDSGVAIYGLSDPDGGRFDQDFTQVKDALKADETNVLLTHRPELIDNYRQHDFDVIMAGHAHGGQWRVPFLVNGVYTPNQGLFPKYAGGLYEFDRQKFIVSRGLARESTRVPRLFNRPELIFIHLKEMS